MDEKIIFSNEYIKISSNSDDVYFESFRRGLAFDQLNIILSLNPQIDISNFNMLRTLMNSAPRPPEKVGTLKERVRIEILNSDLKAIVIYNMNKEELDIKNRENLVKETVVKLNEKGIVFGINKTLFLEELLGGKSYVIAEGIPQVNGNDSINKLYQLEESKPEVHANGTVDFYELQLINRVKVDDWLGERIEATPGIPGKSIKGLPIKPLDGKNIPLLYDKNTVMEVFKNHKTTLYSKADGAVNFADGKISVSNHLEIQGDVDFKTGNIKFDGFLSIKGTVTDGFSVQATRDIEINGRLGLGNVKGIESTQGSIFIKGGIASKGKVEITAAKNIFTKFVDSAVITCNGSAHIGFYCINSIINAGEVIMDSSNGQIIGGTITAEIRVVAPIIGSEIEKKTVIEVTGFNRDLLRDQLDSIFHKISEIKNEQQQLKLAISDLGSLGPLNPFQQKEYNENCERLITIKDEIKGLEDRRKEVIEHLKTRGEGEISITKKAYPNCTLHIKKNMIEITSVTLPTSYYFQDGEIKQTT